MDDVGELERLLRTRLREHHGSSRLFFGPPELAETLSWAPERFNAVMRVLEQRGWLDIDDVGGTHPFAARGFQLTEKGTMALEDEELDVEVVAEDHSAVGQVVADQRKVFIIHGRNDAARNAMEQFVRSLGLDPVDFDRVAAELGGMPFIGDIVREGMKRAHGIIAVITPDEYAALCPEFRRGGDKPEDQLRWQARPNVIFEAGMAYGTASQRTVLVTLGPEVKLFSDVSGIHLVRLDNAVESRSKLRQKLIGMKCAVDERADTWTDPSRSGDFEKCVRVPEPAVPGDPFDARVPPDVSIQGAPSESDARIGLRGWLNKLPVSNSGATQEYAAIASVARVSPSQVRELLPAVVQASGGRWSIQEAGETVVILHFAMPEPTPRRSMLDGGGF